ncbi:hypothetical protein BN130_1302 [Cronobacter malonaticus 507]|nr:hypothetical protein BN130_1302 [Cronobacter malonaticus 507]
MSGEPCPYPAVATLEALRNNPLRPPRRKGARFLPCKIKNRREGGRVISGISPGGDY